MVFARKVQTASGATAVQIAERAGGRDKVDAAKSALSRVLDELVLCSITGMLADAPT